MNKYISSITHNNYDVTDKFERMSGKTKRHVIVVALNRTPEDRCFKLFVHHVKLQNELGYELTCTDELIPGLHYVSEFYFNFEIDPDFCELQDKSVFEISLREAGNDRWETFKYMLTNHSWEEITEDQSKAY